MTMNHIPWTRVCAWQLAAVTLAGCTVIGAAQTGPDTTEVTSGDSKQQQRTSQNQVIIKAIEPEGEAERNARKELAWLGLNLEEGSEALSSQLGLDAGVGLVVTYVAPDSPAAKAGMKKTDVLVGFDNHVLVHPGQLRRLVQSRKEGETVQLTYYRSGKKQTTTATLAKATGPFRGLADMPDWSEWKDNLRGLQEHLRELPKTEAWREQMDALRESLGKVRMDQEQVRREIRRGVEEARRAMREALRQADNARRSFGPDSEFLDGLVEKEVQVKEHATITVDNSAGGVRTIVRTDATGTYSIVASPTKHLTAQDPDGKLLFEGDIETPAQQAAVPKAVWAKVKPLLRKLEKGRGDDAQDPVLEDP